MFSFFILKDKITDPSSVIKLKIEGYKPTTVYCRKVLDNQKFYYKGELGLIKDKDNFIFRVWSPVSTSVQLLVYKNYSAGKPYKVFQMKKMENGVWETTLPTSYSGQFYKYRFHYYGVVKESVDIYSKAVAVNSVKSAIMDPDDVNFENWDKDNFKGVSDPVDAVIYEIHIKDFTEGKESGIEHKGEYLGLTEENTVDPFHKNIKTGLSHLKELGVNYVHILPIQDFSSVNELDKDSYNWGYDPYLYDVPEGSYSTNPKDPASRILEVKKMVYALHKNGIGVILDTVYNHTAGVGNSSPFDLTVPYYFYRLDYKGNYLNGSGCGNEVRTEGTMVRKYILDSLKYWMKEYHVDGFRFDLLGLFDFQTVKEINDQLHKINPDVILYGEPWGGFGAKLGFVKGDQKSMELALFNDGFRDGLRGSVFNSKAKGFINSGFSKKIKIERGVVGSIDYDNSMIQDFAFKPSQSINYVSCHDNLTLWDKDKLTTPNWPESFLKRSQKLAAAVILTSQGVPFLNSGFEFCRTKDGNDNSYNAGITVNKIGYNRKYKYYDVFKYVRDLISLRRDHPIFRIDDPNYIRKYLKFYDTPSKVVGFSVVNNGLNDTFKKVVVFYNSNLRNYMLPIKGEYKVVFDDNGYHPNGVKLKSLSLAPLSAVILAVFK
jgi:pullulanase